MIWYYKISFVLVFVLPSCNLIKNYHLSSQFKMYELFFSHEKNNKSNQRKIMFY